MTSPWSLGIRTFEFSDGLRRFALCRGSSDGIDRKWAVSLLQRLVRQDHMFRQRLTRWVVESSVPTVFGDELRLFDSLVRDVLSGRFQVIELEVPQRRVLGHRYAKEQSDSPTPPPMPIEDVIDDDRSLILVRCDPELADGPLKFTYLIRGLAGRPATVRIVSESFPGHIVFERALPPVETADGPHDAEWDGIVSSPGPLHGRRLSATYGPAKVEVRHDDIYCDDASFVIPQAKVVLVEVGGLCFETDREVLLPDTIPLASSEPGPARIPSLVAIEAVIRYANRHPDKSIFVAGHADTVGSDTDNMALSRARAQNVQLYVSGDRDGWVDHCLDNHETADQQRILAWVSHSYPEFDCDPGPIDNDFGPLTRAAQNSFRETVAQQTGEEMPQGDGLKAADWRAFYSLYDRGLQDALGDALDLQAEREKLEFADPAFAGFGESFPSDRPDMDDLDSERNRRVEVVFLDEAELTLAADTSGEAIYGEEADVLREHIPLGFLADPDEIALRIVDEYDVPIESLEFEIEGPDGTVLRSTTDDAGESRIKNLLRGTYL